MNQFPCPIRTSIPGGEARYALGDPLLEHEERSLSRMCTRVNPPWSSRMSEVVIPPSPAMGEAQGCTARGDDRLAGSCCADRCVRVGAPP